MALAANTASATRVAGSRETAPGRAYVASVDRSEVEPVSPGAGLAFDEAPRQFQEESRRSPDHGRRAPEPGAGVYGFTTSSQTFAAILEAAEIVHAGRRGAGGGRGRSYTMARAIRTYETNAAIIAGAIENRGQRLSLHL